MVIFPAVVWSVSFFLVTRLIVIFVPYHSGKTSVSLALSGFIGSFLFLPISTHHETYSLVPFFFMIMCVIGLIGCLVYGVNPLYQKGDKQSYKIIHDLRKQKIKKPAAPVKQTLTESQENVASVLKRGEYEFMKDTLLNLHGEKKDFPFLVFSPSGIYHIYPYHFGGRVEISNKYLRREVDGDYDIEEYNVELAYRSEFLRNLLTDAGFSDPIPIRAIVCLTNPTAYAAGRSSEYTALNVSELSRYIDKQNKGLQTPFRFNEAKELLKEYEFGKK